MENKRFYITTPLYYPSGKWHIGHAYTTVCCDTIARFKRMSGYDVFFLTGTDEHGQKIEERSLAAGLTPKQFVDRLVDNIHDLWSLLDISYDKFIRTTDDYHVSAVQKIFTRLYEQGDIYKAVYKGKYCTPCESFWTESQLVDGKCPDCGREVIDAEEESYFFRLSKYQDRILKLLTETDFLQPSSRVNEMVNNFVKEGLQDIAVSRTSIKWGIPVPFDEKHTIYVWIDALTNYINALGYDNTEPQLMDKYWPASVHMVGKEIVRFHAIIWPAILMALDLPLPRKVYGHGWLLLGGDKMSKSKGNVADPFVLATRYGIDALRYYLLREVPFGSDGAYTDEAFLTRINSDLVNDYGNLVKRTVAMANQYFGGEVQCRGEEAPIDNELIELIDGLYEKVSAAIEGFSCSKALDEIFALISRANKYIDDTKPWVLNKENNKSRLERVIYNLLEAIQTSTTLLVPFITRGTETVFAMLGIAKPTDFNGVGYGKRAKYVCSEDKVVYARLDVKKELESLAAAYETAQKDERKEEKNMEESTVEQIKDISIDEFFKAKLAIGEILACEKVEKADRLLKSTVKIGEETRTIVSGIAKFYTPEEMVGKKVVVVTNLVPRKIRGIESHGMLLCASIGEHGASDEKLCLLTPEKDIESGSEVG